MTNVLTPSEPSAAAGLELIRDTCDFLRLNNRDDAIRVRAARIHAIATRLLDRERVSFLRFELLRLHSSCLEIEAYPTVSNMDAEVLTRRFTVFFSFDDLLAAEGCYRPSFDCGNPERRYLADLYDLAQARRGDSRRVCRYNPPSF